MLHSVQRLSSVRLSVQMLFEFIVANREDIIRRTGERVRGRAWPSVSSREIEHGVPLFLTQLSETLRSEATATPFSSDAIAVAVTLPDPDPVKLALGGIPVGLSAGAAT